jgi:hypothetical protein
MKVVHRPSHLLRTEQSIQRSLLAAARFWENPTSVRLHHPTVTKFPVPHAAFFYLPLHKRCKAWTHTS